MTGLGSGGRGSARAAVRRRSSPRPSGREWPKARWRGLDPPACGTAGQRRPICGSRIGRLPCSPRVSRPADGCPGRARDARRAAWSPSRARAIRRSGDTSVDTAEPPRCAKLRRLTHGALPYHRHCRQIATRCEPAVNYNPIVVDHDGVRNFRHEKLKGLFWFFHTRVFLRAIGLRWPNAEISDTGRAIGKAARGCRSSPARL